VAAPPPAPPHLGRLLARLRTLDAPLIQLWGWPGSGAEAVLEALLAAEGDAAHPLALADLAGAAAAARAAEAATASGARWLVLPPLAAADLVAVERLAPLLTAGRRLVFAAPQRLAAPPLACSWLPPAELLLLPRECAALCRAVLGTAARAATARALHAATDGWYRPLRLAAEAVAAGAEPTAAALAARDDLAAFLRLEVLVPLSAAERDLLAALAQGEERGASWDETLAGRSADDLAGLRDGRGLLLGGAGGEPLRLPVLLRAFLVRESGPQPAAVPSIAPQRRRAAGRAAERETETEPGFEVTLLGAGRVRRLVPGRPPALLRWSLRRAFKALAYLAVAPGMEATRDELAEAVWHQDDEGAIRRNFHPTLSHLRRALLGGGQGDDVAAALGAPPVELRHGVYRLSPRLAWRVDAVSLERRCEQAREARQRRDDEAAITHWEEAWRLFGGPFLGGEDDPWIADRRDRYQRLHLELLGGLGEVYSLQGRLVEATDALRAVLIEDPLQERVALALMRVYGRQGRRDLVRRQYDRLSAELRSELGVEPMPEITEEYHRLMA
jgi:DNA-binding SARP family transcriptional activator